MNQFRSFLNCDSPALVAIWRTQPEHPLRYQPLTTAILEDIVLSKPYFDPRGLIVACQDQRPLGFVHVGLAPPRPYPFASRAVAVDAAVVCALAAVPDAPDEVTRGLVQQAETYARSHGARTIRLGGRQQQVGFYLGLYGGALGDSVLSNDALAEVLRSAGFLEQPAATLWQRETNGFRPPVDRQSIQWRRSVECCPQPLGETADWGDAAMFARLERTCLTFRRTRDGGADAVVRCWDVEPLSQAWGRSTSAVLDIQVADPALVGCALAETIKFHESLGVHALQLATASGDQPLADACRKLGFTAVAHSPAFDKALA